jgi:hypothetical protein
MWDQFMNHYVRTTYYLCFTLLLYRLAKCPCVATGIGH